MFGADKEAFAHPFSTLLPRKEEHRENHRPFFVALRTVTLIQWLQFFSGWLAWTCDAIDYFSVSLSVSALQDQFDRSTTAITTAITLTLLFRSAGAIIFGLISDRYGRKWPLVINLMFCCVFQIGTGFTQTYHQFLGVRALFGVAMGGVFGLAASTALENLPVEVRGVASGVLQEGYAVGYLIAAVISLFLVPEVSAGWRALFWTGAGISAFGALIRAVLPESEFFLKAKAVERARGVSTKGKTRVFVRETGKMLKRHWFLCVYAVLLMTGFNFLSHGSQDLYPTYMEKQKGFGAHDATVATIIGNVGAVAGGIFAGGISQYIGRRLTIMLCCLLVLVFIPLWTLPSTFSSLAAGAFCIQFGVQGAWGIIPILLNEMSPPAFRGFFPGVAYQLGNMISSASAQIEARGSANLQTLINGKEVPNYAKVQQILIGIVAAYVFIIVIFAPENRGSHFEKHKTAFEEGAGEDDALADNAVPQAEVAETEGYGDDGEEKSGRSVEENEKAGA